jgi:hypothetical protein
LNESVARTMMRPSRAAAVKDGPTWGPPGGLVLDGREHGGRLVCVGISRVTTLVVWTNLRRLTPGYPHNLLLAR